GPTPPGQPRIQKSTSAPAGRSPDRHAPRAAAALTPESPPYRRRKRSAPSCFHVPSSEGMRSILQHTRDVARQITPQVPGHHPRLQEREPAYRRLLIQQRVGHFLPLALLVGRQHGAASALIHEYTAA